LIDTESATHETTLKLLERFTLAGDFRVADVTSELAMLSLQGKRAEESFAPRSVKKRPKLSGNKSPGPTLPMR